MSNHDYATYLKSISRKIDSFVRDEDLYNGRPCMLGAYNGICMGCDCTINLDRTLLRAMTLGTDDVHVVFNKKCLTCGESW